MSRRLSGKATFLNAGTKVLKPSEEVTMNTLHSLALDKIEFRPELWARV
jgi:hypothetical protein